MSELNEKLSIISRVVVHPKYRTIGLGARLVRDTLLLAGTEFVELPAVMAKYNPFAERAGMKRIAVQQPSREVLEVLKVLEQVGFNVQLLGSETYIHEKLSELNTESLEVVKDAFIRHAHPRFLKTFVSHIPFGTREQYRRSVSSASLQQLVGLVKICGFLLQSKVYLFWDGKGAHRVGQSHFARS